MPAHCDFSPTGRRFPVAIACLVVAVCTALPALRAAAAAGPRTSTAAAGGAGPPVVSAASASSSAGTTTDAAWKVASTAWPTVEVDNTANAAATDCTGCRALAVAFAIVSSSYVRNIDQKTVAVGVAKNCVNCETAAIAETWVIASPQAIVLLTPAGVRALDAIHAELPGMLASWQTSAEVVAGTDAIDADVLGVLSQDVELLSFSAEQPRQPDGVTSAAVEPTAGGSAPAAAGAARPATVIAENGYTIYHYSQLSTPTS